MIKKIMQIIVLSLWEILAYIHLFLALAFRIIPCLRKYLGAKFEERFAFELKNSNNHASESFFLSNKRATVCFQLSSEGEYEQVRWLVEELVNQQHLVEIVFTSPSVEHKIVQLQKDHQEQVRILRTPIVTISTKDLSHWITAPQIIMVRYDFYPMFMTLFQKKELILIWFFRPSDKRGIYSVIKWSLILPSLDFVIASNSEDWWWLHNRMNYKKLLPSPIDFRSLSIVKRIQQKENVLQKHFSGFATFLRPVLLDQPTILHGNAYDTELHYLADFNWKNFISSKKIILGIVAHNSDSVSAVKIKETYQINIYEITSGMSSTELDNIVKSWREEPGIFLFKGRGFLLELYSEFKIALVGGGFKGNTHSILEPYLAGCMVYCGQNIQRSSEYFQVKDLDGQKITSLATIEQWRTDCLSKIANVADATNDHESNRVAMMYHQTVLQQALRFLERIISSK